MIYYTHHRNVYALHHISDDIHSQNSGGKQKLLQYILTDREF
jgi:hypothetical protein